MLQMNLVKKIKTSFQIKMSNDHRLVCHTMGGKTVVYDASSWEKVAELTKPKHPGYVRFSNKNDYLYIKNTIGTICVYDTTDFQLIKSIQSKKSFQMIEGDFALTNEPFILLDTLKTTNGNQLALINIDNGEYRILTDVEDSITLFHYHHSIINENSHLFTFSNVNKNTDFREYNLLIVAEDGEPSTTIIDNPLNLQWESVIYDSTHEVYILVSGFDLIIVNSTFKKVLRKRSILCDDSEMETEYFCYLHQSINGRFIIVTYSNQVFILRFDDLNILLVEKIPYACFAEFSDDDQYLLIGTWKNGYVLENNL